MGEWVVTFWGWDFEPFLSMLIERERGNRDIVKRGGGGGGMRCDEMRDEMTADDD